MSYPLSANATLGVNERTDATKTVSVRARPTRRLARACVDLPCNPRLVSHRGNGNAIECLAQTMLSLGLRTPLLSSARAKEVGFDSMRSVLTMLFLLSLVFAVVAGATTFGETTTKSCVIDGTPLSFRTAKTRLVPAPDRHVGRGRIEPLVTCPTCRWVGVADDLTLPHRLTQNDRRRVHSWLKTLAAPVTEAQRYERAAAIAAQLGDPGAAGHRYLMAAAHLKSTHPDFLRLRRAARDALLQVPDANAYVVGELSRQLGDRTLAATWLSIALGAPETPDRVRAWALEGLNAL